jgi:Phage capsid family
LSHDFSDNPDTATSLDAFEIQHRPTARRPGVGRARPCGDRARNVVSGQANQGLAGRYLVTPDPAQDEPETISGAPVLTTTQRPCGTAILLDTTKMGRVAVREPIAVRIGFAAYDFRDNIVRYVAEERLNLAVERSSAILALPGLLTS